MNIFDLTGKTIVVTGAGSGLGKSYAHALASAGAEVVCADRDATAAEDCVASIVQKGHAARPATVDVGDETSVNTFASLLAADGAALDGLVNNAGIASLPMRTHEVDVADWDRVLAVNLRGMFLCCKALIPLLLRKQASSIINISSVIGEIGIYPGFAITATPYASSKAAVLGFTRQLAVEYAREGLRANAIVPGWHGGTQLGRERRKLATPQDIALFEKHITATVPMGRRGKPAEMDGLIVYLASNASSYVTGQSFAHDGGLTAA